MSTNVEALSSLLGIESGIVEASLKDETLGSRIADFSAKMKILPVSDFEKLTTNLKKEAVTTYEADLVEKAKRGELNPEIHKIVLGAGLEMKEKKLAKKYGITDYSDLEDLIDKVKQMSGGNSDEKVTLIEHQLSDLKKVNKLLELKAQEAETNAEKKIKDTLVSIHREKIETSLPYDSGSNVGADAEKVKSNQRKILSSLFNENYSLELAPDGKPYVVDKTGGVLKDSATLEPLAPETVYMKLAKEFGVNLKSPEAGGLGGSSSAGNNHGIWTKEQFLKDAAKVTDSNAWADLRRKYKKENPAIEI
jgi:hypothetical protein